MFVVKAFVVVEKIIAEEAEDIMIVAVNAVFVEVKILFT